MFAWLSCLFGERGVLILAEDCWTVAWTVVGAAVKGKACGLTVPWAATVAIGGWTAICSVCTALVVASEVAVGGKTGGLLAAVSRAFSGCESPNGLRSNWLFCSALLIGVLFFFFLAVRLEGNRSCFMIFCFLDRDSVDLSPSSCSAYFLFSLFESDSSVRSALDYGAKPD